MGSHQRQSPHLPTILCVVWKMNLSRKRLSVWLSPPLPPNKKEKTTTTTTTTITRMMMMITTTTIGMIKLSPGMRHDDKLTIVGAIKKIKGDVGVFIH